jgi:mortality factor 4-like protein 1
MLQNRKSEFLDEFVSGVQLYFIKSLGNSLLYKSEYKQFEELKSEYPDKSPADLYGAEHLLRLFGKYDIQKRENIQLILLF